MEILEWSNFLNMETSNGDCYEKSYQMYQILLKYWVLKFYDNTTYDNKYMS